MNDVSAAAYLANVTEIVDRVATTQLDGVQRAADIVARSVLDGGVVQAFGTGHSQATAMEIAGRAGGLIPTNRIALSDLVMYGGEDPGTILDSLLPSYVETSMGPYAGSLSLVGERET